MIEHVEGGYKKVKVKFRNFGNGRGQVFAVETGTLVPAGEFYTSHVFDFQKGDKEMILTIAENQLRDGSTKSNGLGGDVNEAIAEAGWPDGHGFWFENADKSVRNVL